jgi:hypothetical protein
VAVLNAPTAFEQSYGGVPLPSISTVIVDVADKDMVVKVPEFPLKTIVAVFPVVAGFVVLYVTV